MKRVIPIHRACDDRELKLLRGLYRLMAEPGTLETRKFLLNLLDAMHSNLRHRLYLVSMKGYMVEVLRICPHWDLEVESLYQSNLACIATLKLLRERIHKESSFFSNSLEANALLHCWSNSLVALRSHENRITQDSCTHEPGEEKYPFAPIRIEYQSM